MSRKAKAMTLLSLHVELHLLIQKELLRDPDLTFTDYQSFRLVCKDFDDIWSPVVMSHFLLFPTSRASETKLNVEDGIDLLDGGSSHLESIKTLTLRNWVYLNGGVSRLLLQLTWMMSLLKSMQAIIMLSIVVPIYLCFFAFEPKSISALILARMKARRHVVHALYRVKLPNVRCVHLYLTGITDYWVTYWSSRLLLALPQLTEVELFLDCNCDPYYLVECLLDMYTLQKLGIHTTPYTDWHSSWRRPLRAFSIVIAHNPNLRHVSLTLDSTLPLDLGELLCDIALEKPLTLEHISLVGTWTNLEAFMPHIIALRSFEAHSKDWHNVNAWCSTLSQANIFPPSIKVDTLDTELLAYLLRHPGVENLSVKTRKSVSDRDLFRVLAHHAGTLKSLALTSIFWEVAFTNAQSELGLLICSGLREITLNGDRARFPEPPLPEPNYEKYLFPISRLSRSINIVIRNVKIKTFKDCLKYCSNSEDPLMRDLAGRILYEENNNFM